MQGSLNVWANIPIVGSSAAANAITYYGTALKNAKQYDKAIEMFHNAAKENKDNKEQLNMTRKNLADTYVAMEDYVNGIKYYNEYLSNVEKPSAFDFAGLGTIYQKQASSLKAVP